MCGILLSIQPQNHTTYVYEGLWEQICLANAARGPDAQETYTTSVSVGDQRSLNLRFFASELRLRGEAPVVQPHRSLECVFCWNGEVFEGLELDASENDGVKLFQKLKSVQDPDREVPAIFESIEGPYAMVYLHNETQRIYFGRDPLGRRSLLIHRPTQELPLLFLASVSAGSHPLLILEELSTDSLFCLDLNSWQENTRKGRDIFQAISRSSFPSRSGIVTPAKVNDFIPNSSPLTETLSTIPQELQGAVDTLLLELDRSVNLRVRDIPYYGRKGEARVAVLFSGGIDSTVLAYLADRNLPPGEPIDLLNVAFENPRKIQSRRGKTNGTKKREPLLDENGQDMFDSYLVPDRITGLEEVMELRRLCPQRQWNFLEVDVSFEEMTRSRPTVEALMFPSQTVMDLSLALALYHASRGVGHIRASPEAEKVVYQSSARVLLNGFGADELLGGYSRHRTAFASGGWPAVIRELQLDIDRIPTRNLGRDDRVISSHGKEVRHPFLSMTVVDFLAGLPVHHKFDPRLPLGLGDKILLRLAAKKVGLEIASGRKKRAMQFGSHSARMEAGESMRRGDLLLR